MEHGDNLYSTPKKSRSWLQRSAIWWMLLLGALLASLLIWSCGRSVYAWYKVGDQAVAAFHARLDQEHYDEIYRNTTSEFRQTGTEASQVDFFRSVHEKMGDFKRGQLVGFNFNTTTKGTTLVLTYQSEFTRGGGRETFTWFLNGGDARMIGYRINSDNFK
ncbi:MAG TPA: hypothetical protein VGF06_02595 [Terriglobales bacterium]|jgi:hypothetical protein